MRDAYQRLCSDRKGMREQATAMLCSVFPAIDDVR